MSAILVVALGKCSVTHHVKPTPISDKQLELARHTPGLLKIGQNRSGLDALARAYKHSDVLKNDLSSWDQSSLEPSQTEVRKNIRIVHQFFFVLGYNFSNSDNIA